MNRYLRLLESITHELIPYLLIGLAFVIIVENPLWTLYNLHQFETTLVIFDGIVVFFFVTDLIFKWFKVKNATKFIKLYWIDLIAVFPFYLAFRLVSEVSQLFKLGSEVSETAQKIAHESILIKETELLKEARNLEEVRLLRESKIFREARPLIRFLRFFESKIKIVKGRLVLTHEATKN